MHKLFSYIVIAASISAPYKLSGQSLLDDVNFKSGTLGGVHIYGASVFSGYSSSAYPLSGGIGSAPYAGYPALGPDVNYGASASLGWHHSGQRTNLSVMYSGSYGGMVRYSDFNGFSHSLSFAISRQLSTKWTATFSASGQSLTQMQYLSQPSSLNVLTQLPATFDDLAAAFSIGQFSNAQAASMLTGAPMFESPARSLLVGNRILSYSGQAGLSYAHSSRLSFHFTGLTAGGQFRIDSKTTNVPQNNVMPRSVGLNAGVGLSYSLSPRTQFSMNVTESYANSQYQGSYVTNGSASLGRKMGEHWFLSGYAGASMAQIAKQVYGAPPAARQLIGGGSMGFRTYQHTFVASYSRSSADAYGLAAGTDTTASGSWSWRRPGSRWSVFVSAGQQQMKGNGFADLSGYTVSGGVTNRLNSQVVVSAQYSYAQNKGTYFGIPNNLDMHSIRISLGWSPQPVMH